MLPRSCVAAKAGAELVRVRWCRVMFQAGEESEVEMVWVVRDELSSRGLEVEPSWRGVMSDGCFGCDSAF